MGENNISFKQSLLDDKCLMQLTSGGWNSLNELRINTQ